MYRYHSLRQLRYRLSRKMRSSGIKIISLTLVLIMLLAFTSYILKRSSPSALAVSENAAKAKILEIISANVHKLLSSKDFENSLTLINSSESGEISSVEVNALAITSFVSHLTDKLNSSLSSITVKVKVPLGTIMSPEILGGRGAKIVLKSVCSCSALVDTSTSLSSSGLNQTLHSVYLNITVNASMICYGKSSHFSVTHKALLSESLIVGDVPGGIIR